jgi:hypothetical protein
MKAVLPEVRKRRRTVIDAAVFFVVILLMMQMWLLTATLESYLAGHHDAALPSVVVSGVLFSGCLGLYRLVQRIDHTPE